jgi:uncharacterized membrane protein (UPF0127 family)
MGVKNKRILFFVLMYCITLQARADREGEKFSHGKVVFLTQNIVMDVEIAKTEKQRTTGLMFREKLETNKGMIFVYEKNEIQRVWMKNTLIALDVIFISEQGKIVSISKGLLPCQKVPCDIKMSVGNAKYMLEIKSGMADEHRFTVGQQLLLTL